MSAAVDLRQQEADADDAIMAAALSQAFQGLGLTLRDPNGRHVSIHVQAPLIAERMVAVLRRYAAGDA